MGNLLDAERVTREDEHFPKRVANFLKEVRLPENSGRASTWVTALTWSTDLTHHLCSNNMSKLIHELYGQPDEGAAGALLDADCSEYLFARAHSRRASPASSASTASSCCSRGSRRASTSACRRRRCTMRS